MMNTKISIQTYRDIPSADTQFSCCPNYVYRSIENLTKLEMPESLDVVWCRSVGILHSIDGQIFIYGINSTGGLASDTKVLVSMLHLKSSHIGTVSSIVMPCPVQIFGSVQWVNENPVIYVKLIQVLTASKALQIKDTMDNLIDLMCHGR